MHPLVSIISVNYNQEEATLEMLESLEHSDYPNFEVILVDNGSKVDPGPSVLSRFPGTKYIRSEENLGFAGGNNLALPLAKGDYLFYINNDTEIIPGVIKQLVYQFRNLPNLGLISPKILYHPSVAQGRENLIQYAGTTAVHPLTARNKTFGEGQIDNGQFRMAETTAYAHGAAMMCSREVIEKVGALPELFFLYYEELDWCEQITRAGYQIYIDPSVGIFHKESLAVGRDSPMKTYFLNRNRLLFVRRNRSFFQILGYLIFLVCFTIPKNTLVHLLKGEFGHIKALFKALFWNVTNNKTAVSSHGWNFSKPQKVAA